MKTIRVHYDEPARSKSRNVNAYTRAEARRRALASAASNALVESGIAYAKLNGKQIGEARRLLDRFVAAVAS